MPQSYSAPTPADTPPSLTELNQRMRGYYGASRSELLARQPLVLVAGVSEIKVNSGGVRRQVPVESGVYTALKNYTHLVLGGYGVLAPLMEGTGGDLGPVRTYRGEAEQYRQHLAALPVSESDRALLGRVVEAHARLAGDVVDGGVRGERLRQRFAGLWPVLAPVVRRAGEEHAAAYRKAIAEVRASVPPATWAQAVVVVPSAATARRDNLETAMFVEAFGRDALGKRIFFAENAFGPDAAPAQLGTYLIDQRLARDLFRDPYRMWRDVFSDQARQIAGGTFLPSLPAGR